MFKKLIKNLFEITVTFIFFPFILISAIRFTSKTKSNPDVVWGPNAINPIKNNSLALRKAGRISDSYVDIIYSINNRDEFNYYYFDKTKKPFFYFQILMRYLSFIDVLRRYDIFITNYNGGFLRDTKLRFFEHIFWKIGKKKVVVWPYGSDSTIYSDMIDHSFRYGYFKSYPEIAKRENSIKKQICYFTKHADFLIGNIPHHESCPKWDMLTIACYGLDTEEWKPDSNYTYAKDGQNEAVVIIHSPNHRYVKGTEFLIETCEQIKKDGYKIDLKIIEGMKHNRLKKLMKHCDILAAQFLYGYALTEIEGMSLAKPVLSNLENDHYYTAARRYTYFKECPIVSTTPENIKENLIRLIQNPGLRKTIGKKGREFVIKYHSLEGQGLMWSKIIANVWNNKDEDLCDWWKDR